MSDFLRVFLNARSLRAVTRELTLEQLTEGFDKLKTIVDERTIAEESTRKAQAERIRKIEEYKEMLRAEGINVSDLISADPSASSGERKRSPRPPKYKYILNGETKTWTGQGRTPLPIKMAIENGGKLEDFIV